MMEVYRWHHARRANAPNEIYQESSSKFFDCFAVCYYHVSLKLPEITKCYSTWKACCFRWYHSFSKIFIHIDIKIEQHICLFSENSRKHWVRIGEQVICRSMYSYILGIHHYAPNTFSALPNLRNRRILANTLCESQFSPSLVNLCKNIPECWQILGIRLFSPILR